MRQSAIWLSVSILFCLRDESSAVGSQSPRQRDGRVVTSSELSQFDSDFENGRLDPWIEESQTSGVQWKIENKISPWDLNNKAPPQLNGTSYLRVDRGKNFKFGVAVLRSPAFSLPYSENEISLMSFSFWIRSKWPQFTNLELYLAENGNERLMLSLYNYSDVTNQAWETQSISLLGRPSSSFSLVFYAYCGIDSEDAVAIDDIRFMSNQFAGTETTSPFNPTVSTEVTDAPDISRPTGSTTLSSTTISSSSTITTITDPEPTTDTTTIPPTTSTITTITNSQPATTETTIQISTTSTTTLEPTTTTTTSTSTVTTTTEEEVPTTTTLFTSFTCPDTSEKKYPVPENPCNGKYYLCSGGIATLMNCQENLIFNSLAQLCTPCSLVLICIDECPE